jgi:hypothetical protein
MYPIVIKTGEKLVKFWTIQRSISFGAVLFLWIVLCNLMFHSSFQQVCFNMVFIYSSTSIAHLLHIRKRVIWGYNFTPLGLYRCEMSFTTSSITPIQIATINEIDVVYYSKKNLIIKTTVGTFKVKMKGEVMAHKCAREIRTFVELNRSQPEGETRIEEYAV